MVYLIQYSLAPLGGFCAIVSDGELGGDEGLAEGLAVGMHMCTQTKIFIPAEIEESDLLGPGHLGSRDAKLVAGFRQIGCRAIPAPPSFLVRKPFSMLSFHGE